VVCVAAVASDVVADVYVVVVADVDIVVADVAP